MKNRKIVKNKTVNFRTVFLKAKAEEEQELRQQQLDLAAWTPAMISSFCTDIESLNNEIPGIKCVSSKENETFVISAPNIEEAVVYRGMEGPDVYNRTLEFAAWMLGKGAANRK